MKKVLAALLVLALVAPTMAVTISGTDIGAGKLRLTYDVPTGEVLRGVALKLSNTDGATIAGTAAVTNIDSFFDVFIDYAFSVPGGFTVTPRVGHPVADPAAAGQLEDGTADFPASTFSLSMGVLDETGNQGGVEGTGVLCEIQFAGSGTANITVEADTLRGGAVVGDAVTQPATIIVPIAFACNVSGATVTHTAATPNGASTRVNSLRTETFVGSAVSSLGHALQYSFTWGDGSPASTYGSATQTHVYTYTASTTYNVTVTARCTVDGDTDTSAALACRSEAVKSSATFYATWAAPQWNRPHCWAFQRNCRGDTNSLATGLGVNRQWVNSADLTLLAAGFNKIEAALAAVPNGICADFNRLATGLGVNRQWVNSADLTILATYFNKVEASCPICVQTNYHYWTSNTILY